MSLLSMPEGEVSSAPVAGDCVDRVGEKVGMKWKQQSSLKRPSSSSLRRRVTYDIKEKWYFPGKSTARIDPNKSATSLAANLHKQTSTGQLNSLKYDEAIISMSKLETGDEKPELVEAPLTFDDSDTRQQEKKPRRSRPQTPTENSTSQQNLFVEKSFLVFTRDNPVRKAAMTFIQWRWFERVSIFVILINCVTLGAVDPCEGDNCVTYRCQILQLMDHFIFGFFAIEMCIKLLAMGVIGKNSYLAESWNRLDFFIVIAGAAEYGVVMENINLSAIRTIRVLRPLRAINRIPSLRLLVMLLLDTLPMLGNVLLICFFVFFVFGIAGVQLWAGVLRQRCFFPPSPSFDVIPTEEHRHQAGTSSFSHQAPDSIVKNRQQSSPSPLYYPSFMPPYYRPPQHDYVCSPSSGILHCSDIPKYEHYDSMCIDMFGNESSQTTECKWWSDNYTECLPLGPNPARGTISFDNIGLAWVAIFQVISLEGWTEVMYLIQDAYSFWVWIYFVTLIVIGAFFAVNLCLVVIATQFSETKRRELAKMKQERRAAASSLSTIQESGSVAQISQQGSSSLGGAGQSNIYTQLLDVVAHAFRLGLRWYKRRQLRLKLSKMEANEKKETEVHPDSPPPPYENGSCLTEKPLMCSSCRASQLHPPKPVSISNGAVTPNSCAPHRSVDDDPSEVWVTPATSPLESPMTEKQFLQLHSSDSTSKDQQSCSNDVFVSLANSEAGDDSKSSCKQLENLSNHNSTVNESKKTSTSETPVFFIGEDRKYCLACLELQHQKRKLSALEPKKIKRFIIPESLRKCISEMKSCIDTNREWWRNVIEHPSAVWIIMGAIVINALSMGAEHHNQPEALTTVIESMNLVFTSFFVAELLLKVYVYTFVGYIRDGFNMLDFVIVIISVVELGQGSASGLSVLRTFRLVRIVKLIRFLPALQRQLYVMLKTIDNVATFFLLLSLFLFIFSVLGMSLFGCKFCPANKARLAMQHAIAVNSSIIANISEIASPSINSSKSAVDIWLSQQSALAYQTCPRANFDSLLWSLLTVFQVLTQEAWASVLKDGMHYTSEWAALYFVLLVTFGNYVLFNLLVAILVEGFSTDDQDDIASNLTSRNSTTKIQATTSSARLENCPAITVEDVDDPTVTRISILHSGNSSDDPSSKPAAEEQPSKHSRFLCKKDCWLHFKLKLKDRLLRSNFLVDRRDYSLFLLSPENVIRRGLKWFVCHPRFDHGVLLVIVLNCMAIAAERPSIEHGTLERKTLDVANYVFNLLFITEAVLKISAHGFIIGDHTYMKNGWNVLDFMLISLASIDMLLEATDAKTASTKILEIFRVMRLLRAFRPLRVINRAPGLKIVVQTLILSVKPIGNIVLICLGFFLIFGILGVQLFRGCFFKCVSTGGNFKPPSEKLNDTWIQLNISSDATANEEVGYGAAFVAEALTSVKTKNECLALGFEWENENYNFDNLGNGLMTLFVFSTFDGWVKITRDGLDCVGVDKQPIHDYNPWRLVYFISFLLIVGFFVLNMFVGVVVNNFQKVRKQIEAEIAAKKREIKARKLLERLQNKSESKKRVLGTKDDQSYWKTYPRWRQNFYRFCTHKYFDLAVAGIIGVNVLVMAMEFHMMPREFLLTVKALNYGFTAVFILEASAKLVAFGPKRYFRERWNQLDVAIVIFSLVGIALEDLDQRYLPINPTIIRVARVFRIARVFKLLKMAKGIRELLDTVSEALPQVGNLSLLFMLLFFIYASLGVELFGKFDCTYKVCEGLSRHANFHNFGIALLTLFRISTGDNWNGILKDTLRLIHDPESHCAHEPGGCFLVQILSPFYFVSFVLVAQFVLINVVVAVLMRQLEDSHTKAEIDPEKIEAELEGKVEEIEKIVQEKCPGLVARLQNQIGSDREDAISLVSTEYILRERHSLDNGGIADSLMKAGIGVPHGLHENKQDQNASLGPTHQRRSGFLSATTSFRKKVRPRLLTTVGEHSKTAAEAVKRKHQLGGGTNLLAAGSEPTVNHDDGTESEYDDAVLDQVVLEQVFKDLAEQLGPSSGSRVSLNKMSDNSRPESSISGAGSIHPAVANLTKNALLLAAAATNGDLSSEEAARLVDAFSELDDYRSAVDVFVELRRQQLQQGALGGNSSPGKTKLSGAAHIASTRVKRKSRTSKAGDVEDPLVARQFGNLGQDMTGTLGRSSYSEEGVTAGAFDSRTHSPSPDQDETTMLLRLRTSTV